jgi:hypothetical protein
MTDFFQFQRTAKAILTAAAAAVRGFCPGGAAEVVTAPLAADAQVAAELDPARAMRLGIEVEEAALCRTCAKSASRSSPATAPSATAVFTRSRPGRQPPDVAH